MVECHLLPRLRHSVPLSFRAFLDGRTGPWLTRSWWRCETELRLQQSKIQEEIDDQDDTSLTSFNKALVEDVLQFGFYDIRQLSCALSLWDLLTSSTRLLSK